MKITKYEHSCLDVVVDGKRLLIDPGVVTTSIPNYDAIVAVIVTHVHPDHYDLEKLTAIHRQNPNAPLYTVQAVADAIGNTIPCQLVQNGQKVTTQGFSLSFSGEKHALIHDSIPLTDNTAVLVNGTLFNPGDSFTLPSTPTEVLALPMAAPWAKVSETMDYLTKVKPKRVIPIHNALLSEFGTSVYEYGIKTSAEAVGAEYCYLKPVDSITV